LISYPTPVELFSPRPAAGITDVQRFRDTASKYLRLAPEGPRRVAGVEANNESNVPDDIADT
jgi:hypothetical protein